MITGIQKWQRQVALVSVLSFAWLPTTQAQQTSGAPQKVVKRNPPAKPFKRNEKEFQVDNLTAPPELPNLPAFPASSGRGEFVSATSAPNTLSGQIYTITYQSKEAGDKILEWYDTAFKNYGWTARRFGNIINAEKDGARCQIFLLRAVHSGFKTNFVVNYTLPPAKR